MQAPTGILEIDLDALAGNYRRLTEVAAGAEVAPAVKADAYGLGLEPVARTLAAAGARRFFVASLTEGLALRRLLPDAACLVLNGPLPGEERDYIAERLVPVLNTLEQVALWTAAARAAGRPLPAALHLDSGINRLGLTPAESARLAAEPGLLEGLAVELVMSHLACSDDAAHAGNAAQLQAFRRAADALPGPVARAPRSLAASCGIFLGEPYRLQLVRPGYALYGGNPTPGRPNPMRPVVRLQARVLQSRRVDPPAGVGYGATHRVERPARLVTLAIGYADGLFRALSNRGRLVIDGQALPIVGRISMDLTVVDASALPAERLPPGGFAEILGPGQDIDALAAAAGTVGYEVLTALGRRHRRVYRGSAAGA
jgi:alanine racemase